MTLGSTTTALEGSYSFDGLGDGIVGAAEHLDEDFGISGTSSIGDSIWLDLDGSRDPIDPGFPGALVTHTWYGADGVVGTPDDVVLPTQTTRPVGRYLFERLPAGSYRVDVANIPAGMSPSVDPDGGADSTSVVALTTGQSDLDHDFGYVGTASVGDAIWLDLDRDGVQDAGEPRVPGVTVTVRSPGPDGALGTADDLVVQVDTDASGVYVVKGLPAGTTIVSYDVFDLGAGLRPRADLDGGDLSTATVLLATGDNIRNVDFGVAGNASVIGSVWIDLDNDDVRDRHERGLSGVSVNITWAGPNGLIVNTVVTDDCSSRRQRVGAALWCPEDRSEIGSGTTSIATASRTPTRPVFPVSPWSSATTGVRWLPPRAPTPTATIASVSCHPARTPWRSTRRPCRVA